MVEKFWFDRAKEFLKISEKMLKEEYYWFSCFSAHQAVEFLLKGVQLKYSGKYLFIHDLSSLLGEVEKVCNKNAPHEIYLACDFLTPHYTSARYSQFSFYDKRRAEECVNQAKKVFDWINQNIETI